MTTTPVGRVSLCLLGAVLLAVSQPQDGVGPLALVALVPWVVGVRACGIVEAVAVGAVSGTLYGCLVAPWIPEALRALGSSPLTSFAGLIVTAAWAKAWVFAALAGVVRSCRNVSAAAATAVTAFSVLAVEWIVGSTHWGVPWGLIGHSQVNVAGVAQLAAVGGVPLVSALLLATNVAIAWRSARVAAALLAAWASLALLGVPVAQALRPAPHGAPVELLLVQPDLPRGERWGEDLQALNLKRVATFVARALPEVPGDVAALVLPENLLTAPVDAHPELEAGLRAWVDALGVPVLTGLAMQAHDGGEARYRSAVVWITPGRGITARLDKVRAVPVLESARLVPGERLLGTLFGDATRWKKVEEASRAESGPLRGAVTVTPVLCYEALFPGLVADRRAPDSIAIVNLADDGWVAGDAATRQLTAFATFRAIEQRLALVRVAHGGLSVVIDPYGRRVASLPLDQYAVRRATVQAHAPPTLWEKAGLLALPLGAGLGVGWAAPFVRRSRP